MIIFFRGVVKITLIAINVSSMYDVCPIHTQLKLTSWLHLYVSTPQNWQNGNKHQNGDSNSKCIEKC